ncbi:hypothetical protein VNI00_016869 [Paramarasmius palmivorus]|uniref:Uncharacterized protein n=1 Tax=Paramarasmius palmivorus TaxID=297713 RepID=A0AAW0BB82_9AGAR
MVAASFTLFLASCLAVGVHAIVGPTEPTPGNTYNEGSKCNIQWQGDKDGKWKDMSIQLMTGDNLNMVHLTTVATGLDGNKDGKFDYNCPKVSPNSEIYFYQFSAPGAPGKLTWTGRFTIADSKGNSVPPENTDKDGNGKTFMWGTGKLDDASSAKPPPSYLSGGSAGSSASASSSSSSSSSARSSSASSSSSSSSSAPTTTPSMTTSVRSTATLANNSPQSSAPSSEQGSSGNSTTGNRDNGAASTSISRTWQTTLALVAFASVFTFFL